MVKPLLAEQISLDDAIYHPLLRSDGHAVACGSNYCGQCSIPPVDEGISYSLLSPEDCDTVLFRSDGQAVTGGSNSDGQCSIPSLLSWRGYVCDFNAFRMLGKDRVVQVDFLLEGDRRVILTCVGLDGLEVLRLKAHRFHRAVDVCHRVGRELFTNPSNLRLVLPGTIAFFCISKANPFSTCWKWICVGDKEESEGPEWAEFSSMCSAWWPHLVRTLRPCPQECQGPHHGISLQKRLNSWISLRQKEVAGTSVGCFRNCTPKKLTAKKSWIKINGWFRYNFLLK